MPLFRLRQRKLRMTTYIPYTQRNADHEVVIYSDGHLKLAEVITQMLNWTANIKESGSTFTAKVEIPGGDKTVAQLDRDFARLQAKNSKLHVVEGVFYATGPGRLFGKITFQVA
jgi:hypothetical protein